MLHSAHGYNLECIAHRALNLDDVERFGSNDAFVRISFDMKNWEQTVDKKGSEPEWQQVLLVNDFKPEHDNLYVEVLDKEAGCDEIIAFCCIPLKQVRNAPEQKFSGMFDLYTPKSAMKGSIALTLRAIPLGQEAGSALTYEASSKKGISNLDPEHEKRIKKLKLKESAEDVLKNVGAAAALGAAGMALFGKSDKKKTEDH
jgi:hypothetical protein